MPTDALVSPTNEQLGLDDHAVEQLIMAFLKRRGEITEAQARHIIEQARLIRLQNAYLDLALKGLVHIDLDEDGQIVWVRRHDVFQEYR